MKHQEYKCLFFVCLLLLAFSMLAKEEVYAQADSLILEKEQHWETYGVGGTCIPFGHNMFLKDVDGDGVTEIITGGLTYNVVNGTQTAYIAPLKIWNWNGKNLTLEKSYKWNGTGTTAMFSCIYATDVDGDGDNEMVTGGWMSNSSINYAQLAIWSWDGSSLVLLNHKEWAGAKGAGATSVSSIAVGDLDKDGKPEIITGEQISNDTKSSAQLRIWHLNGNNLVLIKSVEWSAAASVSSVYARVTSVYASDVDGDGVPEIITCGYDHDLKNSTGQLRLWKWNGNALTMEDNEEWRMTEGYMVSVAGNVIGNTIANALDVGDVDGDGKPEIVTGGFTYDGTHANAQIVIWKWNGNTLTEVGSSDWHTQDINEVKSVSINDVDGDERQEIVTSGVTAASGSFYSGTPEMGQLRVWGWDGKMLALKNGQDWFTGKGECAWNVATGDIDKDGVTEIITVGCMYVGTLCDPDVRIWSIPRETAPPPYALLAAVGIVVAIALAIAFLWVRKKRQ